ncbi:axin-2 isoform X2 [Moschus berezovskii]|uniref:axin-2 isoform X2 n=1 Tax=Moschus berezovskii TaxID=68408 RepID=UPI0024451653|nr:axin-2 isoform X2 [Moschus berezovskii]
MSSAVLVPRLPDPSSSFREDAPRPPVPGEEGETPPCQPGVGKGPAAKAPPVSPGARRNEGGLGEPEGRASPDSPLTRWTKSLHSLLGDQDGAYLFRTFLEREKCVDTLDFWFACNGFRQMNLKDAKTLRVAKAIYKRYIENNSIVSKQLKPATKTYIRDSIKKQQIDSVMFDQAQTEVQAVMEENAYQMFLTSDIYLEYVRSGGENPAYLSHGGLGSLRLVCGYLPTLNEEEEWTCADFKCKLPPTVVGLSSKTLRATASARAMDTIESGYRDGVPPYRVGSKKQLQREMHRSVKANGQVSLPHFPRTHRLPKEMTPVEPAAFAAELISRLEKLKLELETRHSLEERLQQIREDEEKEGAELAPGSREAGPAPHPLCLLPSSSYEEDPQTILDDHLSRVLKTPGCQSPGVGRYSPRARSPDHHHRHHLQPHCALPPPGGPLLPAAVPASCSLLGARGFVSRQTTKHVHHHYIHHHAGPRTRDEAEAEAAPRARCPCPVPGGADYSCCAKCKSHPGVPEPPGASQLGRGGAPPRRSARGSEPGPAAPAREAGAPSGAGSLQPPGEEGGRAQVVWQWVLESERPGKPKPHSAQSTKRAYLTESARASPAERAGRHHLWGGSTGHPRAVPRAHPACTQDSAVPPLTPPNTLAQLEEACRRLAEVSKPPKQRCCAAGQQRDRSHPGPGVPGASPFSSPSPASEDHKEPKKLAGVHALQASELVVTYFFCGEEIPYRRMLKAQSLTLGHFKEQLSKKGNYRYYFKKASDEFACGAVFEEVWDDEVVLPMYEGRILGKVERID